MRATQRSVARACRQRLRAGFTLAEVLIATAIVGVGLVAVSWLMTMAARTQAVHAAESPDTLLVAEEIHALAETLSRTPSDSGAATSFSGVLALDSLDGATFNPPISADGTVFPGRSTWTQRVDISQRDIDDVGTVVDDAVSTVVRGSTSLYLLQVDILEGGSTVGSHRWWIRP